MNSDFVDSSKRQTTFNPSDRRKLNDLNLIRNDPINPRKALDFKLSPYGDIQTNRTQNRYSAPSLNPNPRARYSTEYDHRFSTEIPVNTAHSQNDSAYKLERIRQNIGGSNNRFSQGSTDALISPKTEKQKENARNVVTRAVSQKMLSETNSGSQPNLHLFEQESHLPRSAGLPTDRSANMFYGHPVSAGQSGMSAARSHQNLAHIGFSQPSSIYSPNDNRRSSQPGSPMSPVSPVLPQQVNHFNPGQQHSPFNGVPITPYGLNSPDSASISSDSPSQDQPRVPTINHPYQQSNRAQHLPQNYVQKQPATSKPPPYSHHMASNYQSTTNGSTYTLPQKLVPPNVKMRPKPSNIGVKMNNRVSCPVPPPQYCNWTNGAGQSSGQSLYEKRAERALSGMDFCPRTSDPFMDIDNFSRPTSGYDSDYRVGSQASSECASDLNSAMGMNQDWTDESSTVFNMNHVKIPPAYPTMETRSDYASSENSSYLGMDDKKYNPHQNGFNNDSVVTIRQVPGAHSNFRTNDVIMRSPTTSPNQSTDFAIRQHAEEKKKKSKGIFSLFRKDSESSKANQNASPSSTEKITSSMATATLDEKDKHKPRKRVFKTIREVPPRAFKFYMEQRIDNLMKAATERIERKRSLENEMCGQINSMTERDRDVMRQMLRKKETHHLRLTRRKMNIDQFTNVKQLGKGAFGTVSLVRKKDTGAYYALKMLNKKEVVQRKQIAHVKAERDILKEADNDWIVKLYYSFQDEEHLYFALEYIPGGDLMALLIRKHIFKKPLSQFYTAELVQAVASVHEMGFIHRDIKPDNVLIGRDGHIKLTDFGLCTGFRWTHDSDFYKPGSQTTNRLYDRKNMLHRRKQACSVVGTPNYIAPEVLRANGAPGQGYTKSCDWWSVGVILFEMIIGQPPFAAQTPLQTQEMILAHTHTFQIPHTCPCPRARALMQSWIVGEENRLSDPMLIRNHPFFAEINWQQLRYMTPPFIPTITGIEDTSNFDPVEPDMGPSPTENDADPNTHTLHQAAFVEFTFRRFFDLDGIPRTQQQTQSRPVPNRRPSAAHPVPHTHGNPSHPHGPVRGWP